MPSATKPTLQAHTALPALDIHRPHPRKRRFAAEGLRHAHALLYALNDKWLSLWSTHSQTHPAHNAIYRAHIRAHGHGSTSPPPPPWGGKPPRVPSPPAHRTQGDAQAVVRAKHPRCPYSQRGHRAPVVCCRSRSANMAQGHFMQWREPHFAARHCAPFRAQRLIGGWVVSTWLEPTA